MAKVMVARNEGIVVGVDTHRDVHVAVALSGVGAHLGTTSVPATVAGSSKRYIAREVFTALKGVDGL